MRKEVNTVVSQHVTDKIVRKILHKFLQDFNDYLFGKTRVESLIGIRLVGESGYIDAHCITADSYQPINDLMLDLADHGLKNWGNVPSLKRADLTHNFGSASLVLGTFEKETMKIFGVGFCVDSPYGQEALDVLKTISLRANLDYQEASGEEFYKNNRRALLME
jgi:hypothetical protein